MSDISLIPFDDQLLAATCFCGAQSVSKYGNKGAEGKEIKWENGRGRRKVLDGYHGT